MKTQGRTLTGLGLVLLAVIAILAAGALAQNAHASAPTNKSTYPAPLHPCGICSLYFSDITQTCAPDGSVDWVATVTNNSGCVINAGWVANLLIQRNYGDYEVVQSIPGGPQDFPPGDTNIGGSFNYPIPPDATGQQVVIQFDTPGDPCGIVENTSGVSDPCVSTTGTPVNTSTRTRTRTSTPSLPTNTRTNTRTNTPALSTNTRTNTAVPNTNTRTRTATSIPATRTRTNTPTDTPTSEPPTDTPTGEPPTDTPTGEPEPTDTPTIEPPTDTPIPQETCPPGAPTRIPTPAFTPGPGCSDTPPAGVLTADITDNGTTTEAMFQNNSTTCSYRIGLAVYKKFDENIDNQELYDYRLAIIPPNSTIRLTVNNPPCAYQGDAFYGDIIYSFAGGVRYGTRNLDTNFGNNGNYCTLRCIPATPTRTGTVVPPTNTRTRTRTNTPTGTVIPPTNTRTRTRTPTGTVVPATRTATPGNNRHRMTGGGHIEDGGANRDTSHGFQLRCDATDHRQNLEVNWEGGNKWHLETLTSATCIDDPALNECPPCAGFDTYIGTGIGRFNNVDGATAEWTFTDDGEPGTNDYFDIVIRDMGGNIVLDVSDFLEGGNHQAHK